MTDGKKLVEKFLENLLIGDEQKMAELFSNDAILLPTLSGDQYVGREKISKYFKETFLPQNPCGEVVSGYTQKFGTGILTIGGDWNFRINGQEEPVVYARYTMVFKKKNLILGGWEIVQMHSSILP